MLHNHLNRTELRTGERLKKKSPKRLMIKNLFSLTISSFSLRFALNDVTLRHIIHSIGVDSTVFRFFHVHSCGYAFSKLFLYESVLVARKRAFGVSIKCITKL